MESERSELIKGERVDWQFPGAGGVGRTDGQLTVRGYELPVIRFLGSSAQHGDYIR